MVCHGIRLRSAGLGATMCGCAPYRPAVPWMTVPDTGAVGLVVR
jgi:hypothetical protein